MMSKRTPILKLTTAALLAGTFLNAAFAQCRWEFRDPFPTAHGLVGMTHAEGLFVAVGFYNTILTSPDAITWTPRTAEGPDHLLSVAHGNGRFVAVGTDPKAGAIRLFDGNIVEAHGSHLRLSEDGITWREGHPIQEFALGKVVFAQGLFVATGIWFSGEPDHDRRQIIATSPDGEKWTERWRGTEFALALYEQQLASDGRLIATTTSSGLLISRDGLEWTVAGQVGPGDQLVVGGGQYLVVDSSGLWGRISADGVTWDGVVLPEVSYDESGFNRVLALLHGEQGFVALCRGATDGVAGHSSALVSPDGRRWTVEPLSGLGFFPDDGPVSFIDGSVNAQGTFVIVGETPRRRPISDKGWIYTSSDALNWTQRVGRDHVVSNLAVNSDGLLVADQRLAADLEQLSIGLSRDGRSWETISAPFELRSRFALTAGNGRLVAAGFERSANGGSGRLGSSSNGKDWVVYTTADLIWDHVWHSSGRFIASGGTVGDERRRKVGLSSDGLDWVIRDVDAYPRHAASDGRQVLLSADRSEGLNEIHLILRLREDGSWQEVQRQTHLIAPRDTSNPDSFLLAAGNGRFVALPTYAQYRPQAAIRVSTDGLQWKRAEWKYPGDRFRFVSDLIYANGRFFACELNGEERVFSSIDGEQWVAHSTGYGFGLRQLAAGPQGLFALGKGIRFAPWDLILSTPQLLPDGTARLLVHGPPGQPFVLESAPALPPASWQPVTTGTITDGGNWLIDPAAGNARRFYRAIVR